MSPPLIYLLTFTGITVLNAFLLFLWYRISKRKGDTKQPASDAQEESKEGQAPPPTPEIEAPSAQFQLAFDRQRVLVTVEAVEGDKEAEEGTPVVPLKGAKGANILITPQGAVRVGAVSPLQRLRGAFAGGISWLGARLRSWPFTLAQTLFGAAIVIYLLVRLIGLVDYPIYFFTDEAVQTNLAADFVGNNFSNDDGEFLPTYFKNVDRYNLSTSVYVQVIPYLLFGKSIFVTRAVSVLVGLLAAWAVALTLRDIFKIPYWWSGVLLLSIVPAWFLHSRTAFETVLMVAFYAAFLYLYLLYRREDPKHLYKALIMGALAFYSYNPGRVVVVLSGLLLLLADSPYHWRHRKVALRGLGLLVLLALPFVRFQLAHPSAASDQLRIMSAYWVRPIPLADKLSQFVSEYLYGLSPGYWFIPNGHDLPRHLMDSYGNLLSATLPFALLGLGISLRKIGSSAHRTLLIALLAAPSGAALVGIGITRVLVFVIPATLLTVLGLAAVLKWLEKRRVPQRALAIGLFTLLSAANLSMLSDSLVNGPTWHHDYGLGGMQYGARQLYGTIEEYIEEHPNVDLVVSPSWTNGAHIVAEFFFPGDLPFRFGTVDAYMFDILPLDENTVFVTTPDEYQLAVESGKFSDIEVLQTLPYPDGNPGFYFITVQYVDDIEEILAREIEERRELVEDTALIDGQIVRVTYSPLDMGDISKLFDGDPNSVARTLEANPMVVVLAFPDEITFSELSLVIGSSPVEVRVTLDEDIAGQASSYSFQGQGTVENPQLTFPLDEAVTTQQVRIEIEDLNQGEPGHVHVWEIEFK